MSEDAEQYRLVYTSAGSEEQAVTIARALVDRRLAACVKIVATACSIYRWNDEVEEEEEKLLMIKTAERLVPRVRQAIHELHSYDVPEIVVVPIVDGDPAYLKWISASVTAER